MLYDFPQPTPMIMVLGTHFTRASDVIVPDFVTSSPAVEIRSARSYRNESYRSPSYTISPRAICNLRMARGSSFSGWCR